MHLPLQPQRSIQDLYSQAREPSPLYATGPPPPQRLAQAAFNKAIGSNPAGNTSRGSLNSNGSGGVPSLTTGSSSGSSTNSARSSPTSLHRVNLHSAQQPVVSTSTSPFAPISPLEKNVTVDVHAPAPLLPSFLQDIVQSPTLSPTSTATSTASSAELFEFSLDPAQQPAHRHHSKEFVGAVGSGRLSRPRVSSGSTDSGSSSGSHGPQSIWRLDGEETKKRAVYVQQPHAQEIYATGR